MHFESSKLREILSQKNVSELTCTWTLKETQPSFYLWYTVLSLNYIHTGVCEN